MNIIIFLQEADFLKTCVSAIESQGHQLKVVNTPGTALKHVLDEPYDLMIIEVKDHLKDYNFCRSVKIHQSNIKILAVFFPPSANGHGGHNFPGQSPRGGGEKEQILSIVDDYLVWPVNQDDLLSKIKILSKNYYIDKGEPMVLGDLVIYPEALEAARNGKPIPLRKKEYQLLEFLARNKNKVVNRHAILEYIWNYNTEAMTNTLDVHISNLRRKIDRGYATKMLRTIYGSGYKLCDR